MTTVDEDVLVAFSPVVFFNDHQHDLVSETSTVATDPSSTDPSAVAGEQSAVDLEVPFPGDANALARANRETQLRDEDPKDRKTRKAAERKARREERAAAAARGISFKQGLLISLNYNLSFSVLVFPFQVSRSGWLGGSAILIGASIMSWITARFIATIMVRFPEARTYADMGRLAARAVIGTQRAEEVVLIAFRIFQLLELFMYLLFSVVSVEAALLALRPGMDYAVRLCITTALLCAMVYAVLSPRLLSFAGLFGIISFVGAFALLIGTSAVALGEPAPSVLGLLGDQVKEVLGAYGGILLLFAGHAVYPSIFNDFENKADCMRVVNWTYAAMIICCSILAAFVVSGYGPDAIVALPTGYLPKGTVVNYVGQVLMISKMVLTYGPTLYPIVNELAAILHHIRNGSKATHAKPVVIALGSDPEAPLPAFPSVRSRDDKPSVSLRAFVGIVVTFCAVAVGAVIPSLSFIISFTGAIFAVSLSLTLPSISFLCIIPKGEMRLERAVAFLLCLLGLASSAVALLGTSSH